MPITIKKYQPSDSLEWDSYVLKHPSSTLYHLSGWARVIEKAYGHNMFYLMAVMGSETVGVLPLVHIKHRIFGNSLVSIPFFDLGGVVAEHEDEERCLVEEALRIGQSIGVASVELRHMDAKKLHNADEEKIDNLYVKTLSRKVRMILDLPDSPDKLMTAFNSKLRSQIKVPTRNGLVAKIGGKELIKDFYKVFSINMRDLGSPVHSLKLIEYTINEFPETSRIFIVYTEDQPVACSLTIGYRDMLENPWASSLKAFSRLSPNMLLYWTMLEYACNNGYKYFDFGRSSPEEGTFKFKKQWGALPNQLNWQYVSGENDSSSNDHLEKSKFETMIKIWQKLPVGLTRVIGPPVRKYISL
jgi:serine/alanine adding enzyme